MAQVGTATIVRSSGKWTRDQHIEVTVTYQVIRDDRNDLALSAMESTGIPGYTDQFNVGNDSDPWMFAIEVSDARLMSDPKSETGLVWHVDVVFSTDWRKRKLQRRANPIDEPPDIGFQFVQFTRPAEKDKDDEPILNKAGEPNVPAIEVNDSRLAISIGVNTATMSMDQYALAPNTVNSHTIWGLPPRSVLLRKWNAEVVYWGDANAFIAHQYEFEVNSKLWNHEVLNAGYREKVGGVLRTIKDFDHPRHLPTPLDDDGVKIDPPITSQNAVYLEFEIYEERDFRTYPGIPNPLPGPFV